MIQEHLQLLGKPVKDVVTGFVGMVDGICFDVYGCVQGIVRPKVDKDGKQQDANWFDVKRLKVTGPAIMDVPTHFHTPGLENGPADKPAFDSLPRR